MAREIEDKGSNGGSSGDARDKLAAGWGQMTANMVSPNGSNGNGGGNGRGKKAAGGRGGAAPLPISALPVPEDDEPVVNPTHSLPTNAQGELSPAQRARLGLDIYGDDTPQAAAPQPVPAPAPEPEAAPGIAEQPPAAPSEFDFKGIDPYAQAPESSGSQQPDASGREGPAAIQPQSAEQSQFAPISDEPRLAPVSSEPKLAPVSKPVDKRRRDILEPVQPARPAAKKAQKPKREEDEDGFEVIERDRGALSYGIAWSAFAIVVTGAVAFTSSMSGDPAAATGPGPLIPGLISIALGWVIVLASRAVGRGWGFLMIIPALMLFIGPYVYKQYWATSVEDAARSYLSPQGAKALIDVDASSVVSETVNTDRGCFAITRSRKNNETVVSVVTYLPTTARQQADYSLAPRYAGRVVAGGDRTTQRVFTFKNGLAPAVVSIPRDAPLDCENSVSAPGTGSDFTGKEAQAAE